MIPVRGFLACVGRQRPAYTRQIVVVLRQWLCVFTGGHDEEFDIANWKLRCVSCGKVTKGFTYEG